MGIYLIFLFKQKNKFICLRSPHQKTEKNFNDEIHDR